MHNIRRQNLKPGVIVVSRKIYHEISSGHYSEERDGIMYPFYPDFTSMKEPYFDKLFGLPIAILQTSDENFIEVYSK
jgi:hypothetical protein